MNTHKLDIGGVEGFLAVSPHITETVISNYQHIIFDTAMTEQTKQCSKCKKIKPLSEFGNNKSTKDKKTYRCLQCKRDYHKEKQYWRIRQKKFYEPDASLNEKACYSCKKILPINKFNKDRYNLDGYSTYCKDCQSKNGKHYRNTASGIYTFIKSRQRLFRKRGLQRSKPVTISRKDFINWYEAEPKVCVYCDIPEDKLMILPEHYKMNRKRLAIDCRDNEKGYVSGNIVLACDRCNNMKKDVLNFNEMREIGQKYIKPRWKQLVITQAIRILEYEINQHDEECKTNV